MPLTIQSSARVTAPYVHMILFGEPDVGKTMTIPTAPNPIWLLTEETRIQSLNTDLIEQVYGRPSKEDIVEYCKGKKLKGKELEAAVADPATEIEMTGITYDVPRVNIFDYKSLQEAKAFLASADAAKYQTVFIDSASVVSKMVLDHYQNTTGASGKPMHGMRAYGKTGKEVMKWFEDLIKIPKHFVFICHGASFQHNIAAPDQDPIMITEIFPSFEGNILKNDARFLFSHTLQVCKGRRKPDGTLLMVDDEGKSIRTLRCRPCTPKGAERTVCPRLADQEDTNLTDLFAKLTAK